MEGVLSGVVKPHLVRGLLSFSQESSGIHMSHSEDAFSFSGSKAGYRISSNSRGKNKNYIYCTYSKSLSKPK